MDNSVFDLIPFKHVNAASFIATMAKYEELGLPIILTNGAKMYPHGWSGYVNPKRKRHGQEIRKHVTR